MRNATTLLTAVLALTLAACCAFVPCHPGTWIVGKVTSPEGLAVAGARVSLYGMAVTTNADGCFVMQRASALPLAISVAAVGFKSAEEPAKFGFYRVNVQLFPNHSSETSVLYWNSIPEGEFQSNQQCK